MSITAVNTDNVSAPLNKITRRDCPCGNNDCGMFSALQLPPITRLDPLFRKDMLNLTDEAMNVTSEKEFDEVDKKYKLILQREADAGLIEWDGITSRDLVKLHEVDESIRRTLETAAGTAGWYTWSDEIHLQKAKEHGLIL